MDLWFHQESCSQQVYSEKDIDNKILALLRLCVG
jgi:hypothetical protein